MALPRRALSTHLRGKSLCFLQVEVIRSGSSRVDGKLRGISYVSSGKSSVLSNCEGGLSFALESLQLKWASSCIEGESHSFVQFQLEALASSGVTTENLGNFILPQGSQASFQIARGGTLGFLWSCRSGILASSLVESFNREVRPCLI